MADHTSYTSSRHTRYPYVATASAYLGRVILPSARHRTRAAVNVVVSFVLAAALLLSSFPYSPTWFHTETGPERSLLLPNSNLASDVAVAAPDSGAQPLSGASSSHDNLDIPVLDMNPKLASQSMAGGGITSSQSTSSAEKNSSGNNDTSASINSVGADFGKLPLSFELNQGQTDSTVRYMAHAPGGTFFFTPGEVVLVLQPKNTASEGNHHSNAISADGKTGSSTSSVFSIVDQVISAFANVVAPNAPITVRMQFMGANSTSMMEGGATQPGKINYLFGNDPSKWHTNVPTFEAIKYAAIYPGIDLTYSGQGGTLKGTYSLAPGADPSSIKWQYSGARQVFLDDTGKLQIHYGVSASITEQEPVAWQEIDGHRVIINAEYKVDKNGCVSFDLGVYDPHYLLTIDPSITYSSYLGGSATEEGKGIRVDSTGNIYMVGSTTSTNFPLQSAYQGTIAGQSDVFITKFNPSGSTLLYSTYLGGSVDDVGYGIAVDGLGNAYITGATRSLNFPTANPIQASMEGDVDAFLTKLDSSGSSLVYSTYIGGDRNDTAFGIAVDRQGSAYIVGQTGSRSQYPGEIPYPTTTNAVQQSNGGGFNDAFLTKVNTTGSAFVYSTYLGGTDSEEAYSVTVEGNNSVMAYLVGDVNSANFPVTANAYHSYKNGSNWDAFLANVNTSLSGSSSLSYSTYLGGTGDDRAYAIAVSNSGSNFVTGRTASTDFPVNNAYDPIENGTSDTFVAKLNPALTPANQLVFSTFLGGGGAEVGNAIKIDGADNVYVSGDTNSTDFPTSSSFQSTNAGGYDAYVTVLSASGLMLLYSSYLGGNNDDHGYSLALDIAGDTYVAGTTTSSNFPNGNGYQTTLHGTSDAFASKVYSLGQTPQEINIRGGKTLGCTCNSGQNPINTATGNFWHTFTDMSVPGRGIPLLFTRTYNTLAATAGMTSTVGVGWTHSYNSYIDLDTHGNYQVHDATGSISPFASDFSHPSWVMATLTSTVSNLIYTSTHGLDTYYFKLLNGSNTAGKLDQMTDRNGYTTSLSYDGSGRLTTVTDPAGRTLTFGYTNATRSYLITSVTSTSPGVSNRTAYFQYYSTKDEIQTATDIGGQNTGFTYDSSNRMLTMTDPNGGVVTNSYDTASRVISQTDALTRTLQFAYADLGNNTVAITTTDPVGIATVQTYSFNMLRQSVRNPGPQQAVTTYDYQPGTLFVSSITDPDGHVSSQTFDNNGNLLTTTDPLLRTTQYAYNSTNDLTVVTATNGLTTTFGYDTWGNVTTVARPVTETSQLITSTLTYDPIQHGDVLTVTDPLTHSVGMRYDTYGYPITTTNALTATSVFTYNSVGWLLQSEDPMHYIITATYDTYGELLIVTNTLGYTTTYGYDNVGNLLTMQDANHKTTTNTYDLDNEVTRATNQDGTHSDYGYDAAGRVLTQTNPLGQSTLYGFDDINRRVVMTDALNRSSSAAYDLAGVTTVITDARGYTTTLGYDAAYQLKNVTYHDTGPTAPVSYDYNVLGMRTVMTDGIGTSLYTYDSLNRLKSVQDDLGKTVSYGYDLSSRLTSITYPYNGVSSRMVTRGYDNANQLTSVTDWQSNTSQFGYNPDGLLTGITYANGVTSTIGYNAGNQLTSIAYNSGGSAFLSLQYTPDPVGVITATNEGTRGSHSYEYDPRYRLTGDNLTTSTTLSSTWGYSAATEIVATSFINNGGTPITTTRTYNADNQLITLLEKQGASTNKNFSYTYDNNGNRTQRYDNLNSKSLLYGYDAANRMVSYNSGGGAPIYTYGYNGDGLRMTKVKGGVTADKFSWDQNEGLPLLLQDSSASFVYGPGGMLLEEVTNGGSTIYYHTDELGTVRALTKPGGTVINTYDYDAYGNLRTATGNATYNPFGYTGQYTDSETGFIFLRARYYDPTTQQFLTVDPLVSQTEQAYAYAAGNPTNFSDPSGLRLRVNAASYEKVIDNLQALKTEAGDQLAQQNWVYFGGVAAATIAGILGSAGFLFSAPWSNVALQAGQGGIVGGSSAIGSLDISGANEAVALIDWLLDRLQTAQRGNHSFVDFWFDESYDQGFASPFDRGNLHADICGLNANPKNSTHSLGVNAWAQLYGWIGTYNHSGNWHRRQYLWNLGKGMTGPAIDLGLDNGPSSIDTLIGHALG